MDDITVTLKLHPDLYAKFAQAAGKANLTPAELLELLAVKTAARNLAGQPFGSSPEDTEHLTTPAGDREYFTALAREIEQADQEIK